MCSIAPRRARSSTRACCARIEAMNADAGQAHAQDLVAGLDDLPGDGRPHHRGPRRAQARARSSSPSRWSATSSASSHPPGPTAVTPPTSSRSGVRHGTATDEQTDSCAPRRGGCARPPARPASCWSTSAACPCRDAARQLRFSTRHAARRHPGGCASPRPRTPQQPRPRPRSRSWSPTAFADEGRDASSAGSRERAAARSRIHKRTAHITILLRAFPVASRDVQRPGEVAAESGRRAAAAAWRAPRGSPPAEAEVASAREEAPRPVEPAAVEGPRPR